jgi:uncharacterized protein (TIGR02246 family)
MREQSDPFVKVIDSYREAVLAKDADAFVALYSDDVHVFDTWGKWSLRGVQSWRNMATEWFSSLGSDRVIVSVSDVESTSSNELAFGHAILTYTAVSAEGQKLRSLSNRITLALKRTGQRGKLYTNTHRRRLTTRR